MCAAETIRARLGATMLPRAAAPNAASRAGPLRATRAAPTCRPMVSGVSPALTAGGDTTASAGPAEPRYVVHVQDRLDERSAGHPGARYTSPPLPRDDALALLALLLGGDGRPADIGAWTRAVPAGRRTITLAPAPGA